MQPTKRSLVIHRLLAPTLKQIRNEDRRAALSSFDCSHTAAPSSVSLALVTRALTSAYDCSFICDSLFSLAAVLRVAPLTSATGAAMRVDASRSSLCGSTQAAAAEVRANG